MGVALTKAAIHANRLPNNRKRLPAAAFIRGLGRWATFVTFGHNFRE
jgi:hypothetical protein